MEKKKGFIVYYLLLCEGTTEYNLFAYLTRNKFRNLFDNSNIKFSDKIQVVEAGISQGKLNGVGHFADFQRKYNLIKQKYSGQKILFVLDKDLDDSLKIEKLILGGGDVVQFLIYNSEYLLLKLSGKKPKKEPSDFNDLKLFRNYCKSEFLKEFKKTTDKFKDSDFDLIFNNLNEEIIRNNFHEIFSTLE